MPEINNIFTGYDKTEIEAFNVCKYSLQKFCKEQLNIIPLDKTELIERGIYNKSNEGTCATEFAFTRFLIPFLSNYRGFSLFVDCDFIFLDDISKVLNFVSDKAVYVVQHNYTPKTDIKMEGKIQTAYPRKNWSSFMLFNCEHPSVAKLTPKLINKETGAYLHRFMWINDNEIGKLPPQYNFLVGYYDRSINPIGIHFTDGGPWLESYKNVEFNKEYFSLLKEYKNSVK
jgi:hypothetical protein